MCIRDRRAVKATVQRMCRASHCRNTSTRATGLSLIHILGTPYVWGGSTPETGFACSGYVCWVYHQNGYNVGRTTANGLWNKQNDKKTSYTLK